MSRFFFLRRIQTLPVHVEDLAEFTQHQTEYSGRNTECWAEDNAHVTHRHLVYARVLNDKNQMCCQCAEETVVCER